MLFQISTSGRGPIVLNFSTLLTAFQLNLSILNEFEVFQSLDLLDSRQIFKIVFNGYSVYLVRLSAKTPAGVEERPAGK